MTEARGLGDAADDPPDPGTVQGPAVEFDEMLVSGGPRGEELDEGGMQGCRGPCAAMMGPMPSPRVEVEYCTQCRWLPRAAWLAQELLTTFEHEVGEVALVPGTGGVFTVRVDGETVWDRREQGFPEPTAVKQAVRDRVAPGRNLGHSDRPED